MRLVQRGDVEALRECWMVLDHLTQTLDAMTTTVERPRASYEAITARMASLRDRIETLAIEITTRKGQQWERGQSSSRRLRRVS